MQKYKEDVPGWYIKIFLDGSGNESSRTASFCEKSSPGLYTEMREWEANGGVIEPRYTAEELEAKEAQDAIDALKDQERELLRLISDNEYHLISRRFASDVLVWEAKLDEWAAQLELVKAGNLVEISPKPVFD